MGKRELTMDPVSFPLFLRTEQLQHELLIRGVAVPSEREEQIVFLKDVLAREEIVGSSTVGRSVTTSSSRKEIEICDAYTQSLLDGVNKITEGAEDAIFLNILYQTLHLHGRLRRIKPENE